MPKKNYFLGARRATGTLPPLGREKGGGADEFRKDLSRARGQPGWVSLWSYARARVASATRWDFPKGLRACARDVPGTFSKTLCAGAA
jgi:hypothetical protein